MVEKYDDILLRKWFTNLKATLCVIHLYVCMHIAVCEICKITYFLTIIYVHVCSMFSKEIRGKCVHISDVNTLVD